MQRLVALLATVALLLPVSVVAHACFCEHEDGARGDHAAACTCPMHGGAEPAGEAPAGAHCPLHAAQAAAAADASSEGERCEARPAPDGPSASVLAALAALLRPAVLDTSALPDGPGLLGSIASSDRTPAAADLPHPPTPPPRASSRFA